MYSDDFLQKLMNIWTQHMFDCIITVYFTGVFIGVGTY